MTEILASSMPTNRILLLAGNEIGQLREAGKLSDITYGLMDNKLDELAHVLGGCERLATTPGAFRLYPDPAAYRLPVLYAAAVRPGRRSALP
ncbi:Predicted membrane protein [Klebsiella pneumoniae]|uniref:Predicted membrane protein n=1 Tax=Klebsiella pneumoniae TaxID=573 RepID=A0A447RGE2_KLEPN|nr:Predicted membrane protein [Klebsiella pneumoniae]